MKGRTRQMEVWLNQYFPTPYPVVVRWTKKIAADKNDSPQIKKVGYYGECAYVKPNAVIRISFRLNREVSIAVETLMHEWAHAVVMPNERVWRKREKVGASQDHPDEFWLAMGRIYRAWYDEGGDEESRKFDFK
jgi:hypothetical protein